MEFGRCMIDNLGYNRISKDCKCCLEWDSGLYWQKYSVSLIQEKNSASLVIRDAVIFYCKLFLNLKCMYKC